MFQEYSCVLSKIRFCYIFAIPRKIQQCIRNWPINPCFVFAYLSFKGAYSRGQPSDRSRNLATSMYSIGVWSAGRVRFYPETSHQFDATAAPPSAKIAKRGRAQQFLITARRFCTRCIFDLQFGGRRAQWRAFKGSGVWAGRVAHAVHGRL